MYRKSTTNIVLFVCGGFRNIDVRNVSAEMFLPLSERKAKADILLGSEQLCCITVTWDQLQCNF